MNSKLIVILVLLVVALAVGGYFVWRGGDDCSFSSKKRTLGIDLEAGISDVNTIKGKIGMTDDQVRDFDELSKDLALKYDMLCQDRKQKRVNEATYLCRRNNMDQVLDALRSFLVKTRTAAALADPVAQKEIVLKSLNDLEDLEKKGYGAGCLASMNVSPKALSFSGRTSERSVQISNSGNNTFTYSVVDLPRGFLPQPSSGSVTVGQTVTVAVIRTAEPISNHSPVSFRLRDNFTDEVVVELDFDQQNAGLYEALGETLKTLAAGQNRSATVEDALKVVDASTNTSSDWSSVQDVDSLRYFLAAGLLSHVGSVEAANRALDIATEKNPALDLQPATLILKGIVLNSENKPREAIENFSKANSLAVGSKAERDTAAFTNLLSGAVAVGEGNPQATTWLRSKDVQDAVKNDPNIAGFLQHVQRKKHPRPT